MTSNHECVTSIPQFSLRVKNFVFFRVKNEWFWGHKSIFAHDHLIFFNDFKFHVCLNGLGRLFMDTEWFHVHVMWQSQNLKFWSDLKSTPRAIHFVPHPRHYTRAIHFAPCPRHYNRAIHFAPCPRHYTRAIHFTPSCLSHHPLRDILSLHHLSQFKIIPIQNANSQHNAKQCKCITIQHNNQKEIEHLWWLTMHDRLTQLHLLLSLPMKLMFNWCWSSSPPRSLFSAPLLSCVCLVEAHRVPSQHAANWHV